MRTPWLINSKPNRRASVRLFCFPYAGGGDSIFHSWQQSLPDTIEVCPVQLPGRNSRLTEPPCKEMSQLIRLAGQALAPYLDKPFAIRSQHGRTHQFRDRAVYKTRVQRTACPPFRLRSSQPADQERPYRSETIRFHTSGDAPAP